MADLMNIGTRALLTNQLALSTVGHNISNVNTTGYSRQSVILNPVEGQFSGSGYYGNGVEAATVIRNYNTFLGRQVQLTGSVAAADQTRQSYLEQLEDLLPGGTNGLGAAVSDMLNAFSDIASTPSDLSARTVVLARADDMATRFRSTSESLTQLRMGVDTELRDMVTKVNDLATRIAAANKQIATEVGAGHTPNDLMDARDQLITDLNKLVQTTSIPATDGTIGVFLASSQPLVLGQVVTPVSIGTDEFGDPAKAKLTITREGITATLDESTLGGGSIAGLLRFRNTDLVDAGNLLGRMALALGTAMNDQHHLGLDLDGNAGGDLFNLGSMPEVLPSSANTGGATLSVAVQAPPNSGVSSLAPSDYEITFADATSGSIRRVTDGQVTNFSGVPISIDGLDIQVSGGANGGDRFLVTPMRQAAAQIDTAFSSPRALAMASPVAASAGVGNQGTLTLQSLVPVNPDPNLNATVTITFTGSGSFDVTGTGTGDPTGVSYTAGQTISYNGWSLTLKGTPQPGDTYTIAPNAITTANAGNAEGMLALRDAKLFDGAATTEGFAALMSEIGVRVQGAQFASSISQSIAASAANDQASLSGVNLDEEAAKLLQFQQAYQASAKILQVAQTIFDTLFDTFGR